jgi:hypothetical protein
MEVAMLKKLILAAAGLATGLAASVPAFADNGYHRGHYKHRVVVQERYVVHRPVVMRHYYRPAPRPVYVVHPAPRPRPVVVHHPDPVVPIIFGALVGAAVVHSVISH